MSSVVRLTPEDKQLLTDLVWEDGLPGDTVEVTHFFNFPLNADGCRAAASELREEGCEVWALTETEDDDYWHIAAVKEQSLQARAVAQTRARMEHLAERYGGEYAFWDVNRPERKRADWQIRSILLRLRAANEI